MNNDRDEHSGCVVSKSGSDWKKSDWKESDWGAKGSNWKDSESEWKENGSVWKEDEQSKFRAGSEYIFFAFFRPTLVNLAAAQKDQIPTPQVNFAVSLGIRFLLFFR